MGNVLFESRETQLPDNIDELLPRFKKGWQSQIYQFGQTNSQTPGRCAIGMDVIKDAITFIILHFTESLVKDPNFVPKILEVGSGNGCASKLIRDSLKSTFPLTEFIPTDLRKHEITHGIDVITGIESIEAVKQYGEGKNILLLVSPPPCHLPELDPLDTESPLLGYMDYFAIDEWSRSSDSNVGDACQRRSKLPNNEQRYIIFIGELGASDGSLGMYKYMMENPKWSCRVRKMLRKSPDNCGGMVEKELFIFELN
jgi:hypothetical protein